MKRTMTPEEKAVERRRERLYMYIAMPFIVAVVSFMIFRSAGWKFLKPELRAEYKKLEVAEKKLKYMCYVKKVYDLRWCSRTLKLLDSKKKKLRSHFSYILPFKWRERDYLRYGVMLVVMGTLYSLLFWYGSRRLSAVGAVFEQEPGEETLISHSAAPVELLWTDVLGLEKDWVVSEFFGSRENYESVWQLFNSLLIYDTNLKWKRHGIDWEEIRDAVWGDRKMVVFDAYNINREIARIAKDIVSLAVRNGSVTSGERADRALYIYAFTLLHFVSSFFGGVPTALISRYVKDYTLKRVLALYQSGCALVEGNEKDGEAAELLFVFQIYRRIYYDVLDHLEKRFSQIPPGYVWYRRFNYDTVF